MHTTLEDIFSAVKAGIEPLGYLEDADAAAAAGTRRVWAIAPDRRPRLACVASVVPDTVTTAAEAGACVRSLRRRLTRHYRGLPLLRRLGTFTVLVVSAALYERLRSDVSGLIDTGGLHVNVLLGAAVVHRDELRVKTDHLQGVMDAGNHFRALQGALEQACRRQRHAMGLERTSAEVLSVA